MEGKPLQLPIGEREREGGGGLMREKRWGGLYIGVRLGDLELSKRG